MEVGEFVCNVDTHSKRVDIHFKPYKLFTTGSGDGQYISLDVDEFYQFEFILADAKRKLGLK